MSRGGSRNLGMVLSGNTSGLNGIWFRWKMSKAPGQRSVQHGRPVIARQAKYRRHLYVCCSWQDQEGHNRRSEYSFDKNGADALRFCIALRQTCGWPAPSLRRATQALNEFLLTPLSLKKAQAR